MNNNSKKPIYIKLLKILNLTASYISSFSLFVVIISSLISWNNHYPNYFRHDFLIVFYCFIAIIVCNIIFERILVIMIIKITNKKNPLPKKLKIKLIFFTYYISYILVRNYIQYNKWTFDEAKKDKNEDVNNSNKLSYGKSPSFTNFACLINSKNSCLNRCKYLEQKFKNIFLIYSSEKEEWYCIGDLTDIQYSLKNAVLLGINLYPNNLSEYMFGTRGTWYYMCIFSLGKNQKIPVFSFKTSYFNGVYITGFKTFNRIIRWISKHYPQFNKINK